MTACGAALIEHGSARYSWNERPEGAETYADGAGYVCTSGKTGGTADKSLFVPGRFMICRGLFVLCAQRISVNRYVPLQSILIRTNRQTVEMSGSMEADDSLLRADMILLL